MEGRNEIENALKGKAEACGTPLDVKIHPLPRQRMQSSRTDGDSSSIRPSMQDSGQPDDAATATLED